MPWLVRDDRVLASLDVADSRRARRKGLLGRREFAGALLLRPARSVHSIGMRFALDVAFLDAEGIVVDVVSLRPGRITRPRLRASAVLEAERGAFDRWSLERGQRLEVRNSDE